MLEPNVALVPRSRVRRGRDLHRGAGRYSITWSGRQQ